MQPRSDQAAISARTDQRGEGVISTAIAVLIMAFLGVAMWIGFQAIWDTAEQETIENVNEIGNDSTP
ncbi:MAG: hypothetical protein JJLCMIEE_00607 [Acidimicrobiales bacterium]|nr:MAG: hypothetical protein EDR02_02045 [Actinomycetota bacterium]MBV6507558.1 hypothetical protein [Acidimicrobiales bacterium]RIK07497.1 MAG: hypothetical protein DCC48_03060 [Acidobacteriota bacterium]